MLEDFPSIPPVRLDARIKVREHIAARIREIGGDEQTVAAVIADSTEDVDFAIAMATVEVQTDVVPPERDTGILHEQIERVRGFMLGAAVEMILARWADRRVTTEGS